MIAKQAAEVIRNNGTVAVNCLSGRGRSGTFSAIVLGILHDVRSNSDLVDVVVSMRENRDGMVETPAQFRFVSKVLGLPNTSKCGVSCSAHHFFQNNQHAFGAATMGFLVGSACSLILTFVLMKLFNKKAPIKRNLYSSNSLYNSYSSISQQDGKILEDHKLC